MAKTNRMDKQKTLYETQQLLMKIEKKVLPFTKTVEDLSANLEDVRSELEDLRERIDHFDLMSEVSESDLEIKRDIFTKLFQELHPDVFRLFSGPSLEEKKKKK